MPTGTMTPRERWLAVFKRDKPDRVPMDYWATGEATEKLMHHLGREDTQQMFQRLHIDHVIPIHPKYVGPPSPPGEDTFGCRYQDINYGTGVYSECVYHPLARYESVEEIERNYAWPSPDWYDYSNITDQIMGWEDFPVRV